MSDLNYNLSNGGVPTVNLPRTTHDYTKRHQTTFNLGQFVPFYTNILVQQGDTYSFDLSAFIRMTTSLFPSMDNLYLDVWCWAQRNLKLYNNWKGFIGENEDGEWAPDVQYQLPGIIITPNDEITKDSVLNHMGIPIMKGDGSRSGNIWINRLAYEMHTQCYNEWIRDQNYIAPIPKNLDDGDITYANLPYTDMLKVARKHDYFSSLPQPQKGTANTLPISGEVMGQVYGSGNTLMMTDGTNVFGSIYRGTEGLFPASSNAGTPNGTSSGNASTYKQVVASGVATETQLNGGDSGLISKIDLDNAIAGYINDVRILVVDQQVKERQAIFGSRMREQIKGRWGVTSPALANDIPEYLGGFRLPLNMDTVLQTSSSDATSPQGSPAGYSVTADSQHLFTKSFDQWYTLMFCCAVRQDHTYSQGIARQFQKKDMIDFYQPEYSNIGCTPIYNQEIFVQGNAQDKEVWGYTMPWQEYRIEVNEVTGELSPNAENSLDVYNYADDYDNLPVQSQEWIEETPDFLDRTLAVKSTVTHQFMLDTVLTVRKVSVVPKFGIPGLDKF